MSDLFTWLIESIGPLVKKGLTALGMGWVSFEGITTALSSAKDMVIDNWGQIPATTVQFLELFGFAQFLGIVIGALVARAAIAAFQHLGKMLS